MFCTNTISTYPKTIISPHNFFKKKNLFFCLLLLHNTEIRGFRIIFHKPVNGQLTNSNAATAKNNTHLLFNYKYNMWKQLAVIPFTKPIFIAEYVNLF